MPFGSFPKGLPSVSKVTGVHKIGNTSGSPTLPRRITSIDHLGNMLSGLKNRMSQKYSRLGPPKRPSVPKGKVS